MKRFGLLMVIISFLLLPARAWAFPKAPTLTGNPVIGYRQSLEVLTKLTRMWDAIPAAEKQPVITDVASATVWENEILPYFESEGVSPNPIAPDKIEFDFWPTDSDLAEHTLGTTGICGTDVQLNKRLITPGDPWMASDETLLVLAHELTHVQGVCWGNAPYNDEQSAQIISWEILAAMSNAGFIPAKVSLIADLRNRAFGMTEALAKADGQMANWHVERAKLCEGVECAQEARSDRLWAGKPTELATLLANYYTVPMSAWLLAIQGNDVIDGVMLPINDGISTHAGAFSVAELAAFWA